MLMRKLKVKEGN